MPDKPSRPSRTQQSFPNVPPPEMGKIKKNEATRSGQTSQKKTQQLTRKGGDLFIVDNSDEQWKVAEYLREWCELARAMDIATGYFEIGALLALDGQWQKMEQIRLLMGDEVSKRTHQAFQSAINLLGAKLDDSIEREKESNDFLRGVPAIVQALNSGQINARVYREHKFHAKAYITHSKFEVVGSTALVGSSNFTYPGLHDNIELNVRIRNDVEELQAWYEQYWDEAEDVTPELLKVIERHIREYSPFEVYAKALYEFFKGHEMTAGEWEKTESVIYPIHDTYQKEGYHALMKIANHYRGALLCDSVGLGKTFIGLMVIERLIFERKRVALIVPKSARKPVWENKINKYLPGMTGDFSNIVIYNHTDLLRGGDWQKKMENIALKADAVIIDEAHHFRNQASQSYRMLYSMLEGKQVFLLTATPVNNSLLDLQHEIELFSRRVPDYFRSAPLGIHSLVGHFRTMETALKTLVGEGDNEVQISTLEAEQILSKDELFRALVVQRSRAYARQSQQQDNKNNVVFPARNPPTVVKFSLVKSYGKLLDLLERAFRKDKPLLALAMYNPLGYPQVEDSLIDPMEKGRQAQIVGLIRTLLLKRFESSAKAFEDSCEVLLLKLLAFVSVNSHSGAEKRRLERWLAQHAEIIERVRNEHPVKEDEGQEEDETPAELDEADGRLSRSEYRVDEMIDETYLDMDQILVFLQELENFQPANDDKLQALIRLLKEDPLLSKNKVLIFTEYKYTARYLAAELKKAGIGPLDEVDGSSVNARGDTITLFAPYYNDSSSAELAANGRTETRVLISTDVLSEGLNLQDATLMMNYDLHWNPVRLMQRIGRVDRRLDPKIEAVMCSDHPDWAEQRGKINFWNFLPPEELDRLLALYERVAHKTLRISKTFGIEGRQLLRPEDDYQALKDFNTAYEGSTTSEEAMRLAYRDLTLQYPDLEDRLKALPLRVFSGEAHPSQGCRAVFFCYALPAKNSVSGEWDSEAAFTQWYLVDLDNDIILEDTEQINLVIKCKLETSRRIVLDQNLLVSTRKRVEKHITNTYLKSVQAPVGIKPVLKAWMEVA